MKKSRKRKTAATVLDVPMSSMIDVVFLLLIYFIVTQKDEISEAHLAVNLPSPDQVQQSETNPNLLQLEIQPGQVFVQGVPRSFDMVKKTLTDLSGLDPEQTVIVKISQLAHADEVVKVLDLCQGVGLSNLSIMALK